jgi:uncharacterized protein (DUF488 family)
VKVFTIGFTKSSAESFFTRLQNADIKRVIDVRLNNVSQLAGFAKKNDLRYFLKTICGAEYVHEPLLAPTQELLNDYKKKKGNWQDYEKRFLQLMEERRTEEKIDPRLFEVPTALLCSEKTAQHCHRRLVIEYLSKKWGEINAVHL